MMDLMKKPGMSTRKVAAAYNVGKDTLRHHLKNPDSPVAPMGRPPVLPDAVEFKLAEAARDAHLLGQGFTQKELHTAAKAIAVDLGIKAFQASNKWLSGFKARHGLRAKKGIPTTMERLQRKAERAAAKATSAATMKEEKGKRKVAIIVPAPALAASPAAAALAPKAGKGVAAAPPRATGHKRKRPADTSGTATSASRTMQRDSGKRKCKPRQFADDD
jgi:transposase